MLFRIVVRPHAKCPGKFEAWIEGEEGIVFVSDKPYCEGARRLLQRGEKPDNLVAMRHQRHDNGYYRR